MRNTWLICVRCLKLLLEPNAVNRRRYPSQKIRHTMKSVAPLHRWLAVACLCFFWPAAQAAEVQGGQLSVFWGIPFAGILLSIAILPLVAPSFWHHHFGKVSAAWSLAFLLPFAALFGIGAMGTSLVHVMLAEYIPFILLLTALYTVAGGIFVRGNLHGSPSLNTGILALGAVLASVMGTTGASMLMIRPLI